MRLTRSYISRGTTDGDIHEAKDYWWGLKQLNPRIIKSWSLKTRVTLFTLAIFLLSIWSLSFYVSQMLREDMQRLSGEQQFSAVSKMAAGNSATLPADKVIALIHEMQQRMLLATIFLTLLAGALTWWMLRRLLAPMLAAVTTLAAVEDSNQSPQLLQVVRHDEVGELIVGFNRLLETLAQREDALRESKLTYQTLFREMLDGFALHEIILNNQGKPSDYRFIAVNPAFERLTGLTGEFITGKTVLEVLPATESHWIELYGNVALTGESASFQSYSVELNKHFEVTAFRPAPNQFACIFMDITERRLSETYREMARDVLQILNEPEDLRSSIRRVIDVLTTKSGFDAVGIRLQDGNTFPYYDQSGFSPDLLQEENSILDRCKDVGTCRDAGGAVNPECICGMVIAGKTDPDLPFFTVGGSFWTNDSALLLNVPPGDDPRYHPRNHCTQQGYASIALVPVRNKEHIVGLIQFNDRRKGCFTVDTVELLEGIASHIGSALMRKQAEEEKIRLEAQYQQTQKLESLGVLAGGIAHDFNNILSIILGHCHILEEDIDSGIDSKSHIQHISRSADRAAELCRQMLSYAGKSELYRTNINVCLLIDENVKMLKSAIKKDISIELDLARDVPEITGDNAQIQQVVMNLIINAAEAIDDRTGTISIALDSIVISDKLTDTDFLGSTIPSGRYACLTVSDNGCGIDPDTLKRIFEPFFTTKFTGRGLGMSAVLGIITSHHGSLQLSSIPGIGTTFKVYLPLNTGRADQLETGRENSTVFSKKMYGTVLLVDDEEGLRVIGSALLKAMGFTVITAADGNEAVDIFRDRGTAIDLILLDLIMPGMDGREAYRNLRAISPATPIVFSSGYYSEAEMSVTADDDKYVAVIQKPYKSDQLRTILTKFIYQPEEQARDSDDSMPHPAR
jgi:PAS domain S-box-containing protein